MTKEVFFLWLKAEDVFEINGKQVFTGPSPFELDTKDSIAFNDRVFKTPLLISHPEARKDRYYKVISVEHWLIGWIAPGDPIGLMVEEIDE